MYPNPCSNAGIFDIRYSWMRTYGAPANSLRSEIILHNQGEWKMPKTTSRHRLPQCDIRHHAISFYLLLIVLG